LYSSFTDHHNPSENNFEIDSHNKDALLDACLMLELASAVAPKLRVSLSEERNMVILLALIRSCNRSESQQEILW
jgi:hypothetical protein